MKKIVIFIVFIFSLFATVYAGGCNYSKWDVKSSLNSCLSDTTLVNPWNDLDTKWWAFSSKIYNISKTIAIVLSVWAVFWIVYGSFMMVTAAWEDEKIKKAKDMIKWSIVWFLGVVLASSLIALITNFIFDLG
jgi:hypothetical protein